MTTNFGYGHRNGRPSPRPYEKLGGGAFAEFKGTPPPPAGMLLTCQKTVPGLGQEDGKPKEEG